MNIAAQIKIMRQLMKDYPWLRKVFGSNLQGRHGAGQALEAQKLYGATPGVGEGMMGRAYALPTKATPQQPLPLEEIGKNITTLGGVAEQNPKLGFMIPQIGIGQAGYTPQQVAPLFKPIANQRNIALPSTFRELIQAPRTPLGEFLAKSPILSSPGGPRVLHTGGAKGADTIFQRAAEEAGHKVRAYSFAGHARGNKSRIELSSKHLEVADEHLHRANQTLRRKFPTSNSYVNNLLRRNLYQVKDSDQIIAVAPISKGQVEGGTAWATQMGIDMGKPVFVFDLNKNQWMTWGGQSFIRSSKPTLSANYAGVGSRNITSPGAKAIKDLFGKSDIKGINITTHSEDRLGRVLTNPNWGLNAKDKKRFFDVETPYKAGKSKAPTTSQRMKEDQELMQSLIETKFRQNPEIIKEINKRGGLEFLQASWHIPSRTGRVNPNSRWDGGVGESAFIQTLIKAYKKVSSA